MTVLSEQHALSCQEYHHLLILFLIVNRIDIPCGDSCSRHNTPPHTRVDTCHDTMEGSENVLPPGAKEPVAILVEDPGKDVIQTVVKIEPSEEVPGEPSDDLPEEDPHEPPHQLPSAVPSEAPDELPDELSNTEARRDGQEYPNNGTHGSEEVVNSHHNQAPLAPASIAAGVDGADDAEEEQIAAQNGRRELTEAECESELGYAFPSSKKWMILTIIFLVQLSMNFNTSLYSSGIAGIAEEFDVTHQIARYGAALFLVTYAIACELWAPWSEELGRWWVLQLSLLLTNISTGVVGTAQNVPTVLVGRALGGLSTAGGSVTLGLIADLYDRDNQQYAVAFM